MDNEDINELYLIALSAVDSKIGIVNINPENITFLIEQMYKLKAELEVFDGALR